MRCDEPLNPRAERGPGQAGRRGRRRAGGAARVHRAAGRRQADGRPSRPRVAGIGGAEPWLTSSRRAFRFRRRTAPEPAGRRGRRHAGDQLGDGGFQECTGLDMEMDVGEYVEGGRNNGVAAARGPGQGTPHRRCKRGHVHPAERHGEHRAVAVVPGRRRRRTPGPPLRRQGRGARRRGSARSRHLDVRPRPAREARRAAAERADRRGRRSRSCRSPTRACGWRWPDGVQEGAPAGGLAPTGRRRPRPSDADRGPDQPGDAAPADGEHRRHRQGRRAPEDASTRARPRRCRSTSCFDTADEGTTEGPVDVRDPDPPARARSCCPR